MKVTTKIIAYYRVSTKRQGISGLGLDAQQAAVEAYAKSHGARIVASYKEIESGKRNDRPQLEQALGHARLAQARLVVAKLDRLGRNVAFLSALIEAKVDFVACDNEHANTLTLHVLAAVAQAEVEAISQRTKHALAQSDKLLGSARPGHWKGREHQRAAGLRKAVKVAAEARSKAASKAYGFLLPTIIERRAAGDTLETIAASLNDMGHETRAGKPFTPTAIHRLLARCR